MSNKISVITVVYNDVHHIRKTIESFFSQTWEDKEYIIIDGGSTDGTVDIIKEYSDRLAYWCSERDGGIYDAMNKGISHATGDWINILNSGDYFYSRKSLEKLLTLINIEGVDVVYGNSIASSPERYMYQEAGNNVNMLEYTAIYRHGSSITRTSTYKKYPFNTSKFKNFGFALDYDTIYRMHHDGCKFVKVPVEIECYDACGASDNLYKSLKYNFRITTQFGKSINKYNFYLKSLLFNFIKNTYIYNYIKAFIIECILNGLLTHIYSWHVRKFIMKLIGLKIGVNSFIMKKNYFISPRRFCIESGSHINRDCLLDARGGITIGKNVSISHNVKIITGGHSVESKTFKEKYLPITIGDYAWLGIGCIILQGVTIGEGAVVCAGAVVSKNVDPYSVVAGIPAKKIKERNQDLSYTCKGAMLFT